MQESNASTHAHDLLDLVAEKESGWSLSDLEQAASERFGSNPTFHTCSDLQFDFAGLIEFITEKEKVIQKDGLIFPAGSHSCSCES